MLREKSLHTLQFLLLIFAIGGIIRPVVAATPAGQDKLRITVGGPKQRGKSQYALEVQYKMDDYITSDSSGLVIVRGADESRPDDAVKLASKAVHELQGAITYQLPELRGATVAQLKEGDSLLPTLLIENAEGASLTKINVIDYSNHRSKQESPDKSFGEQGVQVGIDIHGKPTNGTVELGIGDAKPMLVQTGGTKTTDIEAKLAQWLNSQGVDATVEDDTLVEDLGGKDRILREKEFFDGSEVHIPSLDAKSFTIDVNDLGLGVTTKFKFKDENKGIEFLLFFLLLLGVIGWISYARWRRSKASESES